MPTKTKYIFVTGGVLSGLGKGIVTASISYLLKQSGFKVSPVKCDMYLNMDAGTMNPFEHGEIFVTGDGEECDQDIGHYERFTHQNLTHANYLTSGQVYSSVIKNERALKYNGKCVEAFPFLPDEIERRFKIAAKNSDFIIIELGGTVGEYQNIVFLETARRIASNNYSDTCFIHLGYLPIPKKLGEMKTKPLQQSITSLNSVGIFPEIVICRAEKEVDMIRKKKIAVAAGLSIENIISDPDLDNVYKVPNVFEKQGLSKLIFRKLHIKFRKPDLRKINSFEKKLSFLKKKVKIAMVGKYYSSGKFSLADSYISVTEAIKHASWYSGFKPEIVWYDSEIGEKDGFKGLEKVDGIIVPQGWGSRGVEGKIKAVEFARTRKIPYLGLCFGMQMACIEFARNVCGLKNASSTEANPKTPYPVIHMMPEQKKYLKKQQFGDTIRLGDWPCKLQKNSIIRNAYEKQSGDAAIKQSNNGLVSERHRHRYEFNQKYKKLLEKKGMKFTGMSPDGKLVEAVELDQNTHPFFLGTQFHPEYKSKPLIPHPIFIAFIKASGKNKL